MISAVYRVFSCVYLGCIRSIYKNLIFSCRCYQCFVYNNYLIISYFSYSSTEMHDQFVMCVI